MCTRRTRGRLCGGHGGRAAAADGQGSLQHWPARPDDSPAHERTAGSSLVPRGLAGNRKKLTGI